MGPLNVKLFQYLRSIAYLTVMKNQMSIIQAQVSQLRIHRSRSKKGNVLKELEPRTHSLIKSLKKRPSYKGTRELPGVSLVYISNG